MASIFLDYYNDVLFKNLVIKVGKLDCKKERLFQVDAKCHIWESSNENGFSSQLSGKYYQQTMLFIMF